MKWIVLASLIVLLAACAGSNQAREIAVEADLAAARLASPTLENDMSAGFIGPAISERPSVPHRRVYRTPPPDDHVSPNEVGEIMILVYHGLHEERPGPYDRLTADFWDDLQNLYDQGYRLISMEDLINNNITTPRGYTPVVLSFDDGLPSAFSLKELEDGTLTPVPGTAVYIINAFYEMNPDFGRTAIFFVNGRAGTFQGAGTMEERFRFLIDHGFEIGNHGYTHANFATLDGRQLQREVGQLHQFISRYFPEYEPLALAYPFGIRPRPHLRHYALDGEYNGVSYSYPWALRVGNTGVPAMPYHINFDPSNVSRVVASDESTYYRIVPDLGYLLRRFERYPHLRFISDGDPNTITVPRELVDYVNLHSLEGRTLVVYDRHEEEDAPEEDEGAEEAG